MAACLLFYGVTAAYGVVAGGHWDTLRQSAGSAANRIAVSAGFEMKSVRISGARHMQEAEIMAAIGHYDGLSVFAFDTDRARESLEAEGWIERAEIVRELPSTVAVKLSERKPFALWLDGGKLAAIDSEGRTLGLTNPAAFPALPLFSGPSAPAQAREIVAALGPYPELSALIARIDRIAGRRWDIVLESGMRAKLPASDFEDTIAGLARVAARNPAAFYEISEMDFRSPAQFTLRLKNDSEEARQAFMSRLTGAAENRDSAF